MTIIRTIVAGVAITAICTCTFAPEIYNRNEGFDQSAGKINLHHYTVISKANKLTRGLNGTAGCLQGQQKPSYDSSKMDDSLSCTMRCYKEPLPFDYSAGSHTPFYCGGEGRGGREGITPSPYS